MVIPGKLGRPARSTLLRTGALLLADDDHRYQNYDSVMLHSVLFLLAGIVIRLRAAFERGRCWTHLLLGRSARDRAIPLPAGVRMALGLVVWCYLH